MLSGKECHVPDKSKFPLYGALHIQDMEEFLRDEATKFMTAYFSPFPYQLKIENFDQLCQLGAGAFGVVSLVKYRLIGSYYAMKVMNKKNLVQQNYVKRALNEKLMLQSLNCPFAVFLLYFSQDNSNIYFVLPLIYGGELYTHLMQFNRFSENITRFYAAQVVLAFEYLHRCSVVYRDLKPENILLDHFGFVKITDFGLAKIVPRRTYTFCGTPDYVAPEIILGLGYGKAVDWWTLGVLIFEMSTGRTPFFDANERTIFENIVGLKYVIPKDLKEELTDLIRNLLQRDVTKRIGNLMSDIADIKNHSWFKDINWLALLNRNVIPPVIPRNSHRIDNVVFPGMKKISALKISEVDKYKECFSHF